MPTIGFVAPLLSGMTAADRDAMTSCWTGGGSAAHQDARRRAGITREATWSHSTPMGDVAVVYMEADELDTAFAMIGGSDEPFDVWYRDHVRNVHGIALEKDFPPPELILDYRADSVDR